MSISDAEFERAFEMFASGAFSGNVSEWPQLKPVLARARRELLAAREIIKSAADIGVGWTGSQTVARKARAYLATYGELGGEE